VCSAAAGLGVDPYDDMYKICYNENNNELGTTITTTILIQYTMTVHKTIYNNNVYANSQ
jgi:hypothetical protein